MCSNDRTRHYGQMRSKRRRETPPCLPGEGLALKGRKKFDSSHLGEKLPQCVSGVEGVQTRKMSLKDMEQQDKE